MINLGTNDYGSQPYPPKDVFEGGYQKFINYLRQNYPRQPIFVTCGPMIGDPCCQYVADMAKNPNTYYVDVQHILKFPDDYGSSIHGFILLLTSFHFQDVMVIQMLKDNTKSLKLFFL